MKVHSSDRQPQKATLKKEDNYPDYLMKVYSSARENIFATCTEICLDIFLSGKFEDDILTIHKKSKCKVTRVFVFEDRKDIRKGHITQMKKHIKIKGIKVYIYINNEDREFDFPPDISKDFTVIDNGLVIGIANHYSTGTRAQLTFNDEDDIRRFNDYMKKLAAGSLKKEDPLYKTIFGTK